MELAGFVRSLLRHKVVVGVIVGLAAFAAFLTAFSIGPGGIEQRSSAVGAATSQILVDSAESTLVKGVGTDQLAALGTRASVYAQYLSSREAVVKIAREIHVNPALVTAHGPFSEGTGIQDYQEQGAESRASSLVEEGKSYRLLFQAHEGVPMITVYATAPTVSGALALAHGSFTVLSNYISELKREAKQAEARHPVRQPVPVSSEQLVGNIVVRELGEPQGGPVGGSADMVLMTLAFIGVLGLGCLAYALGSGFVRHWRLLGEMERYDAKAHDRGQEPTAEVAQETGADRVGERWRLLVRGGNGDRGGNGGSEVERESGPAVSGR